MLIQERWRAERQGGHRPKKTIHFEAAGRIFSVVPAGITIMWYSSSLPIVSPTRSVLPLGDRTARLREGGEYS